MRNMELANNSLIVKQAWRIHNAKKSIIHRLYLVKYKNDPPSIGIRGKVPTSASYAFRSMCKANERVKEFIKHHIGNRKSTRIY